ncbi:hypothetical protein Tco_0988441 [Tanacetum coccineum]|uniref:Reverse transcriptase n=1 Tax=Tanacetum coccineum TaxID=301880 RepID=A0ABQ5ER58_9ASTR
MVYQLTKFHVQRVDMVINPPWNLPFLGAKGLTSPEQTATALKNSCCKDKRIRLEVLKIKNNLKKSIYNILRKLKVFKVPEDSPCLKPFLYGKHELLASVDIIPCPKSCVQTWIHPIDLEFLDPVVQCLVNLLQSAVTELVDLIEPHDHLNPIFIPKCDGPWRVNYCEVVLELKASGIPSRFGEV